MRRFSRSGIVAGHEGDGVFHVDDPVLVEIRGGRAERPIDDHGGRRLVVRHEAQPAAADAAAPEHPQELIDGIVRAGVLGGRLGGTRRAAGRGLQLHPLVARRVVLPYVADPGARAASEDHDAASDGVVGAVDPAARSHGRRRLRSPCRRPRLARGDLWEGERRDGDGGENEKHEQREARGAPSCCSRGTRIEGRKHSGPPVKRRTTFSQARSFALPSVAQPSGPAPDPRLLRPHLAVSLPLSGRGLRTANSLCEKCARSHRSEAVSLLIVGKTTSSSCPARFGIRTEIP